MPTTTRELERKYAVDESFVVPPLTAALPGLAAVADVVTVELEATYYDTADLRLAREGITLRRRTGGADEGWHLKLPPRPDSGGGRDEIAEPLSAGTEVPASLRGLVAVHVRDGELVPVGTLHTSRQVRRLLAPDGHALAEIADDRVSARTVVGGQPVETNFRELEVELRSADADAVFEEVDRVLTAAGADSGKQVSKAIRVLGAAATRPPEVAPPPETVDPSAPARELVTADIRAHVRAIAVWEPRVRLDEYDAVHKMRVSVRRLRSTLRTFGRLLDAERTAGLEDELRWLAAVLGRVRDGEVVLERLTGELAAQPPELVLGPVAARLQERMRGELAAGRVDLLGELDGDRYRTLVGRLIDLAADVPATPDAEAPVDEAVRPLVLRSFTQLRRRVRTVEKAGGAEHDAARDVALHGARKAAKRARYAGEACVRAYGGPAAEFAARMEEVQEALGEHQDTVVARELLGELARSAYAGGQNAFTYGLLVGREQRAATDAREEFETAWAEARRGRHRAWLTASPPPV